MTNEFKSLFGSFVHCLQYRVCLWRISLKSQSLRLRHNANAKSIKHFKLYINKTFFSNIHDEILSSNDDKYPRMMFCRQNMSDVYTTQIPKTASNHIFNLFWKTCLIKFLRNWHWRNSQQNSKFVGCFENKRITQNCH